MRREGGEHTACRGDRYEGRGPLAAQYYTHRVGPRGGVAAARGRDTESADQAAHGGYCAENTAMHPCTQVLPDESL
jgi:hypothetical protein